MSNAFRTLAVAAAMACVAPMAAQAAAVKTTLKVDFNDGSWAETTGGNIDYTGGVRIVNGKLQDQDGVLALVSSAANPVADPITIEFTDSSLFNLNALTLEHANGAKLSVHVIGVKGGENTFSLAPTGLGLGGAPLWATSTLGCTDATKCTISALLDSDELIKAIEFIPGESPLGLDSPGLNLMNFTLVGTSGGGGTVPEPAGYGLAALALLAAGAASRRRAKH